MNDDAQKLSAESESDQRVQCLFLYRRNLDEGFNRPSFSKMFDTG